MIPHPWQAIVLGLAAFRVVRIMGWDTLGVVVRARAWAVGEQAVTRGSTNARMGLTSERVEVEFTYRRQWLHELLSCGYCSGMWISLAWYGAWLVWPSWSLLVAFPFALSAFVGTWSRMLDP